MFLNWAQVGQAQVELDYGENKPFNYKMAGFKLHIKCNREKREGPVKAPLPQSRRKAQQCDCTFQ